MASEKALESKKARVEELTEKLRNSTAFVLVDYSGISVEDDTKLRKELREQSVDYMVEKNSIIRFAFKNAGIEGFDDMLHGASAIAIAGEDQTAPARVLGKFAEDHEEFFDLKAGYIDGTMYDTAAVAKLAKIPSKDVLLAQLVGSLQGPIQKLAALLKAVADSKSDDEPAA